MCSVNYTQVVEAQKSNKMKSWLIQSGSCRFIQVHKRYSIKNLSDLVSLDYMGYAEFEFGAFRKFYLRMVDDFENLVLLQSFRVHQLFFICNDGIKHKVRKCVEELALKEFPYELKTYCNMFKSLKDLCTLNKSNIWFDIKNDWIVVYGIERADNVMYCLGKDYKDLTRKNLYSECTGCSEEFCYIDCPIKNKKNGGKKQ